MFGYIKILSAVLLGLTFTSACVLIIYRKDFTVSDARAAITYPIDLPLTYYFKIDGRLNEAGSMEESTSPYWWLNSGGIMDLAAGFGKTNQGNLPKNNKWRKLYAQNNPVDTEDGYKPQNIFRLILRTDWKNISTTVSYKINAYNLTQSPQRSASNGILIFNRYQDSNNTYYTGLRVDGAAVIKKKKDGIYYTLAYEKILPGEYNIDTNPILLPIGEEIILQSEIKNISETEVSIKLFADIGATGTWTLVAEAIDDGKSFGGPAITDYGHPGLRTDFMDVEFDNFTIKGI